jgi:hypothetical protein
MKKHCIPIASLLLFVMSCAAHAQNGGFFHSAGAEYIWPTDASRFMSSTFGETRSAHFHAAIDIKTWGQEGYRVFATRDGVVERIAIGPRGYGKVIYLRHEDNSYSVYAHLLAFEDRIQHIADSLRMEDYSFELDRFMRPWNIRVKQGDVIGYTGSTGIGPPHLHFELRTPDHRPFNPLLTNLDVQDSIAPTFRGLSVEPLSAGATKGDRILTHRATYRNGVFDFGTVKVHGPVGLGVDVFDRADDVFNVYAVYSLTVTVESDTLFHSRMDAFSYSESDQMFLDRVYPLLKKTGNGYQRLYRTDGNTLPFYEAVDDGRLDLEEGRHTVRISAADIYGNRRDAVVTLDAEPGAASIAETFTEPELPSLEFLPGRSRLNDIRWYTDWLSLGASAQKTYSFKPVGSHRHNSHLHEKHIIRTGQKQSIMVTDSLNRSIQLHRVYPERESRLYSSSQRTSLFFPEGIFYDTLSVAATEHELAGDSVRIQTFPDSQPLRGSFEMNYLLDSEQQKDHSLAWYRYDRRRDKLNFLESERSGNALKAEADEFGIYYILSDTTRPVVEEPRIYRREDNRWVASVRVRDNRSGIRYQKAEFTVNGERGIAEYEPEEDLLIYYLPGFSPRNENHLELKIEDRRGNKTAASFEIRDP